MANVWIEENTMKAIGDAIRAKTGKTDLILPSDMATEIASITGGGPTRTEILAKQTLSFTYASSYGAYMHNSNPALFVPIEGESYTIVWDEVEYTVTAVTHDAFPNNVLFGNTVLIGGANTGEPFAVACSIDGSGMTIFALDANETHTLAVYQESGGSSDLVKYVTFMSEDGTTELFKMPVLKGDDCKDAITHGDISKPTKESTNTTNYAYSGWSFVPNGLADGSALKNVTEDRTVYASFTESVRYYTVRFYTEVGTLYETVKVTYGGTATPSVDPYKDDYAFVGWTPSNENITEDTDCYAIWEEAIDYTFAEAPWGYIKKVSEEGTASEKFSVGDEKEVLLADGTTLTLIIADFGVDNLADGSGKAGITIINKFIHDSLKSGWTSSSSATTYALSSLRTYLNSESGVLGKLPSDLTNVIKTVSVEYENQLTSGTIEPSLISDKIFELSCYSVGMSLTATETTILGPSYKVFTDGILNVEAQIEHSITGANGQYWFRSLRRRSSSTHVKYAKNDGTNASANATSGFSTAKYVRFGFCI